MNIGVRQYRKVHILLGRINSAVLICFSKPHQMQEKNVPDWTCGVEEGGRYNEACHWGVAALLN
jgi:hypothetical protein